MLAWEVERPGPVDRGPLVRVDKEVPQPAAGEVRVRVRTCGVCRTDLHVIEGDLPVHRARVTPGHEIVGTVEQLGPGAQRWRLGDRVGVPWLAHTCGTCRFCTTGRENLCLAPRFTGWDVDGGYAEYAVVNEAYAYAVPDTFDDEEAAPLLCAGIIGYRALKRANLPDGGRLGIYGFGGSAHITAQVALARGARIHVMTRAPEAQALAGTLVPPALAALDRGGTLAIAGIHLSDVPGLDYQRDLFEERTLQSVTANTRRDGEEFLREAARIGVRVTTSPYPMDRADVALRDLAHDRVAGAAVLVR